MIKTRHFVLTGMISVLVLVAVALSTAGKTTSAAAGPDEDDSMTEAVAMANPPVVFDPIPVEVQATEYSERPISPDSKSGKKSPR